MKPFIAEVNRSILIAETCVGIPLTENCREMACTSRSIEATSKAARRPVHKAADISLMIKLVKNAHRFVDQAPAWYFLARVPLGYPAQSPGSAVNARRSCPQRRLSRTTSPKTGRNTIQVIVQQCTDLSPPSDSSINYH